MPRKEKNYALDMLGKEVTLPAPIKQKIEIGEMIVVRVYPSDEKLNAYPQEKLNRNVYAFNLSGELVWQIQEAPHGGVGEDKAYMNIGLENGRLMAGNWIGIDYFVGLCSGKVSQAQKNVRPW